MAIQLNLLPDVKTAYIKAERTRRTAITISLIIMAVSVGLVALMASVVYGAQKIALANSDNNIDKIAKQIKETKDVEKILTVQSQLNSLDSLHNDKTVNSRLFGYLTQIVPSKVQISDITVNLTDGTAVITGTSDSLESNNVFVDTLKFTKYQLPDSQDQQQAFSNVVLTSFSRDDKGASFTIGLSFDPVIFSTSSDGIKLVPKVGVTTRADQPNALFNKPAEAKQ